MIVAELMTANTVTVEPKDTLESAHKKMEAGRFRQVLVVDQQKLVGILTDRDTREHVAQLAHTRVDAVMSAHPFSVHPSTPVEEAAHMLVTNKIGSLPVVEGSQLLGIITVTDMLRALEAVLGGAPDANSRDSRAPLLQKLKGLDRIPHGPKQSS
jgi:acetoin utilization protein AcuB